METTDQDRTEENIEKHPRRPISVRKQTTPTNSAHEWKLALICQLQTVKIESAWEPKPFQKKVEAQEEVGVVVKVEVIEWNVS